MQSNVLNRRKRGVRLIRGVSSEVRLVDRDKSVFA